MKISQKAKFAIFGWFVVGLLILLATGKAFFAPVSVDVPMEQSIDEILVKGLGRQEKLNRLANLWNNRNDGYKVTLLYEEIKELGIDRLVVNVSFFFDIESRGDTKRATDFVDKTLGEIAIVTSRLGLHEIAIVTHDYIAHKYLAERSEPTGNIIGFFINNEMLNELKLETDPMNWSLYTELPKDGKISFPNVGIVGSGLTGGEIIINR